MRTATLCWAAICGFGISIAGCAKDPENRADGSNSNMNSSNGVTGSGGRSGTTNSGNNAPGTGGKSGSGSGSNSSGGSGGSSSASSGSGGGGGNAGSSGSMAGGAAVDCKALALPDNTDDIISTFEDGTGNVMQVNGRGGAFYMYNDGTGTQDPAPGMLPDARAVMRCDSTYAMCMTGKDFMTWGAGMGTDLGPSTAATDGGTAVKQPYDLSMYKAVSFWAKSNTAAVSVRMSIKDANTAPEGGHCDETMTSGADACNDDWGKALMFSTDWKPYTVTFAELRQSMWGKAFPSFDAKHAYSVQFQVSQGVDFDLCLDDIFLVR
jgi:hypothetical protein